MKRHLISSFILVLLCVSLLGIAYILVRESMRTPNEYWELAKTQLAEKNYRGALRNLTKAAEGDVSNAQYQLALLYDVGDKIPANREKAIEFMSRAAQKKHKEALYVMGVWTERAYFGKPDIKKAIDYYKEAAKQGHKNAMRSLIARYNEGFGGFPENLEQKAYWLNKLKNTENKK